MLSDDEIWEKHGDIDFSPAEALVDGYKEGYKAAKLPEKFKRLVKFQVGDIVPADAEFTGKLATENNILTKYVDIEYAYYEVYE